MKNNLSAIAYFVLGAVVASVIVLSSSKSFAQITSTKPSDLRDSDRRTQLILQQLKSVVMDTNFFTSPLYKNLEDFSVTVQQEPFKRTNPFAPIGVDAN